jgi:hypothetical protein
MHSPSKQIRPFAQPLFAVHAEGVVVVVGSGVGTGVGEGDNVVVVVVSITSRPQVKQQFASM